VFDLSVCPVHIPAGTILAGGFLVEDHEMTLYGVCGNCSSSTPARQRKRPPELRAKLRLVGVRVIHLKVTPTEKQPQHSYPRSTLYSCI
jgi:hypothetical protein